MKQIPWVAAGAMHRDTKRVMEELFVFGSNQVCVIQAVADQLLTYIVMGDSLRILENLALGGELPGEVKSGPHAFGSFYYSWGELERLIEVLATKQITLVILRPSD